MAKEDVGVESGAAWDSRHHSMAETWAATGPAPWTGCGRAGLAQAAARDAQSLTGVWGGRDFSGACSLHCSHRLG